MQKAQSTAQPTWLETQMVARRHAWRVFQFLVAALRAIAGLAAIAFGHPNGLDALAIGEGEQVADGSVGRDELLLDARAGRPRILPPPTVRRKLCGSGVNCSRPYHL